MVGWFGVGGSNHYAQPHSIFSTHRAPKGFISLKIVWHLGVVEPLDYAQPRGNNPLISTKFKNQNAEAQRKTWQSSPIPTSLE
uniref:Uncharacterized protein n=1 Tax=Vitis vinifera TaxID=29760 RepID=F6H4Q7_VITVI